MKFILKNLFRRKLRTLFSVLGVGIGVSIMVALFSISDDLIGQISQAFETQRGDVVVMESTAEELESDVPLYYEGELKHIDGVQVATPMIAALLRTDADFDDRPAILYYGVRGDNPVLKHMKMREGQPISDDDPNGVVFGWRAWEILQEKMGDKAPKVGQPLNLMDVVTSEGFKQVFDHPDNWDEMTDYAKKVWTLKRLVKDLGVHMDAIREETPEAYKLRTGRKPPPPRPNDMLGFPVEDDYYVQWLKQRGIDYDPEDPVYAWKMRLDLTTRGVCETGIMLQDTAVWFHIDVAQVIKGKHEHDEVVRQKVDGKWKDVTVHYPSSCTMMVIEVGSTEGELTEAQREELSAQVVNDVNQKLDSLRAIKSADILRRHKEVDFFKQFGLVISLIAALAGAVGILNTMTLTVYERTREIGLLLAVGWSRTRVLTSVLVEGLLLSLIGGLVGVAFGYAEVQAARHWFSMDALSGTLNLTRSWQAVGLAFGIGFLASLYPAIRASMLQPIDALRHE
ncbi:MAG: ABC transporter permease [Planctomycetota bacterium]